MFPDTKIVQAEGRTKFIWDLPRRRLSKRRLVLRKVVQAEGRTKFIWVLPRRCLSKRRLVLRKVVQAERRTKFIWDLPRRRLSKRGLSSAKSCKPSAEPNLFGICRGAARAEASARGGPLLRACSAGSDPQNQQHSQFAWGHSWKITNHGSRSAPLCCIVCKTAMSKL